MLHLVGDSEPYRLGADDPLSGEANYHSEATELQWCDLRPLGWSRLGKRQGTDHTLEHGPRGICRKLQLSLWEVCSSLWKKMLGSSTSLGLELPAPSQGL